MTISNEDILKYFMTDEYPHDAGTLAAKEKIDQLQRQNDELVARVARLVELGTLMVSESDDETATVYLNQFEKALNETKSQSLQHIEVAAFESAKVSSQMKADCIGEVSFVIENGNCCPQCWHEPDDDCDICHGQSEEGGFSDLLVQVPWDTMKDIWKLMNKSHAKQLRQQSTNNGSDGDE